MSSELENRAETILIYAIPYSVGENDAIIERKNDCTFPCRTSENYSGPINSLLSVTVQ